MKSKIFYTKGFSLIEIMVACVILGIASFAFLQLSDLVSTSTQNISSAVTINKTILRIRNDLVKDCYHVPPLPLNIYNEKENNMLDFFKNSTQYLAHRCYDKSGNIIDQAAHPDAKCEIDVWFFKSVVLDKSSPEGIDTLPMSRINFKLKYIRNDQPRELYLSFLRTDAISY